MEADRRGSRLAAERGAGELDGVRRRPRRDGGAQALGADRPVGLVVLSGGNLVRWTNDEWTSARHRVVAGGSTTRRSTAVFYNPGLGTVIEPLAPFVGADGPHYEPRTVWEATVERVEDYLKVFGSPEQVAAWRSRSAFVARAATA